MEKQTTIKTLAVTISLMILGGGMSACDSGGTAKWKEEVQLSDGRVIVIEREMVMERGGDELANNGSGAKPREYRIQFVNPDGAEKLIAWRSIKETRTWPEVPMILDVENNNPIVFTSVFSPGGGHIYSKYQYRDDRWVEEHLPETFAPRVTNLLIFIPVKMPEYLDLKKKQQFNSERMRGNRGFAQAGPDRTRRAE